MITAIAIVAIVLILPKDIVNLYVMILFEKELFAFKFGIYRFWQFGS
jgi:hypothetical protein